MAEIVLSDAIQSRLEKLARQESRSADAILRELLDTYEQAHAQTVDETPDPDPLVGLIGLLDEYTDAADLSSTVRETLKANTHLQYGRTKRDRTD